MAADVKTLEETQQETLGQALGKLPSGVFIVTTVGATGETLGMLASFVQQISFKPPMICLATQPGRAFYELLQQTGVLTLNILPAEGATSLMKAFSSPNPDAFDQIAHKKTAFGVDLDDALAVLHAQVTQIIEPTTGDHHLVLAALKAGRLLQPIEAKPMVHLRKSGFNY
ncbi:MAG: flavin reductase family protein [Vampirovibrionales bacterium]|nr:flavin reductase family protein [Vampirovibrionales bacterium]